VDQQRMQTIPVNHRVRPRSDHAIHGLLTGGSSNADSSQAPARRCARTPTVSRDAEDSSPIRPQGDRRLIVKKEMASAFEARLRPGVAALMVARPWQRKRGANPTIHIVFM
jgi:hypothetical protein